MFCFENDSSLIADVCPNVLARARMSLKENIIVVFLTEVGWWTLIFSTGLNYPLFKIVHRVYKPKYIGIRRFSQHKNEVKFNAIDNFITKS